VVLCRNRDGQNTLDEGGDMNWHQRAIQDSISNNHCFGCGSANDQGLQIKSYWQGQESVCEFQPDPCHTAGPTHLVNGGIIATVIDCHCVCTAIARGYEAEGRRLGSDPPIWYATASLKVDYLRPAMIQRVLILRAGIREFTPKKAIISCTARSGRDEVARAEVVAVRVPWSWREEK
jgi:acyl-coenzyme A thioesterase PaaI-like protein